MALANKDQVEIAARLQLKWLERMEQLLESGEITSTDMATLARVLLSNGWNLDPQTIPTSLREKLTTSLDDLDFGADPTDDELFGAKA